MCGVLSIPFSLKRVSWRIEPIDLSSFRLNSTPQRSFPLTIKWMSTSMSDARISDGYGDAEITRHGHKSSVTAQCTRDRYLHERKGPLACLIYDDARIPDRYGDAW